MKFVLYLQLGYYFLDLQESHVERLSSKFPDVEFVNLKMEDGRFEKIIREAEGMATWPFPISRFDPLMESASKLRWIQFSNVGITPEHLRIPREKKWIVTNARGVASEAISLHILGFILSFERHFPLAARHQRERKWDQTPYLITETGFDGLAGKLLGIVGLGSVGKALAEKAAALHMRVWGIKRHPAATLPFVERILPPSGLHELLSASDYVVLSLPLVAETRALIGEQELRTMKKTAYLLNVARGGLIDEAALLRALQEKWIAGAALDVAAEEPLPAESPLYDTPHLILTPHIAGLDRRYTDRFVDLLAENLQNYLSGKPLLNPVDLEAGY